MATIRCPHCGSPVMVRGRWWECGYCGDCGKISSLHPSEKAKLMQAAAPVVQATVTVTDSSEEETPRRFSRAELEDMVRRWNFSEDEWACRDLLIAAFPEAVRRWSTDELSEMDKAGLPELVQQGQIGGSLHLGPGVEDDRGVRGIEWREDGQMIPNLQMISACQYLQGHVLRPVVVGHIPEKAARQQNQDRQQNTDGYLPLFAAGFCLCRHRKPSSHCRITAAMVSAAM